MQRILVIEPSSTLRHAVRRLLDNDYQTHIEADFATAMHQLQDSRYDAVVLGWPSQTQAITDELLTLLSEAPLRQLPVLTLAHDADPAKLNWTTGRPHSAFLLWENYYDARECLNQLLSTSQPMLAEEPHGEVITVLLVDDSPTARVKFSRLLKDTGLYQTITAAGVDEALEKLEHHSAEIAIIDYFMPDHNGDVLCRRLREHPATATMQTAILTSTYSDKVITEALAAGAVECMFKNEPENLFLARVSAMRRTVFMTRRIDQERRRLEGILSSVGDGVFGVNREGIITFANPAVSKIMGFTSQASLIGKTVQDTLQVYCPTDQTSAGVCNLDKTLQQGQSQNAVESTFVRTDGTAIHVEETIYPLHINGQHEGAVIAFRDISMRKLLEEELKWQVNHDALTKLLNRKYLEDSLDEEVKRLGRSEGLSALLYIDLDRFKYINDTIGHTAGDQLLIELSEQLHSRLRRSDLLARIGGDEFGILLRDIEISKLQRLCDNIHELLAGYTFNFQGRSYKVHTSIGAALINTDTKSSGEVLANADIACAIAKSKGRNQTHIYSADQDEKASMDLELGWSVRLQQALESDQFTLYYQPIVAFDDIDIDHLPEDASSCWQHIQQSRRADAPQLYEVLLR
ncbi:MAG: diguanylate cyclase, partial [Gammaproteobacteria bacterium]